MLKTLMVDKEIRYTGEQLSPHWALRTFHLAGDSLVCFIGPCDVSREHMVDLEDLLRGESIKSDRMLHFIIEHFDQDLTRAVMRQRLFAAIACRTINEKLGRLRLRRDGDDLYDGEKKLSVSAATVSPVSGLIHFGMNITTKGVPVPAACLENYDLEPRSLAVEIASRYADELESMAAAASKVRPVFRQEA